MDQRTIDDISDLLQGRDSEHKEYPYGHPKYRPPAGASMPDIPGSWSRVTIQFATEEETGRFFAVFAQLDRDARDRTVEHLKEIGKIEHGI